MTDLSWTISILPSIGGLAVVMAGLGWLYRKIKRGIIDRANLEERFDRIEVHLDQLTNSYKILNHNSTVIVKALLKRKILNPDDISDVELNGD